MRMTRGDTQRWGFTRIDAQGEPIVAIPEGVYFTVKTSYEVEDFILQKKNEDFTIDNGKYSFTIYPNDTNGLDYGTYYYDIEIVDDSGKYKKTIKKGQFVIEPEATWAVNESEES